MFVTKLKSFSQWRGRKPIALRTSAHPGTASFFKNPRLLANRRGSHNPSFLVRRTLALFHAPMNSLQSSLGLLVTLTSQISSSWSPSTGKLYLPDSSVTDSRLYVIPPSMVRFLHSKFTVAPAKKTQDTKPSSANFDKLNENSYVPRVGRYGMYETFDFWLNSVYYIIKLTQLLWMMKAKFDSELSTK